MVKKCSGLQINWGLTGLAEQNVYFKKLQVKERITEKLSWDGRTTDEAKSKVVSDTLEKLSKLSAKEMGRKGCKDSLKKKVIEKLHPQDLKREECRKLLVCTANLVLRSKKLVPFNRMCVFTKRLGLQSHSMWIYQWHNWFIFAKWIYSYAWNLAVWFPEKWFYLIL